MPTHQLATTLSWELLIMKTRMPKIVKLWVVENTKLCFDFVKTQLTVSSLCYQANVKYKEQVGFCFGYETKKTSIYWKEVHEAIDPAEGTAHVICKLCKWYSKHPNSDTHKSPGLIKKHLDRCSQYQDKINGKQADPFADFFACQRKPMTSERLCEGVLKIIIVGNLSFHQAENMSLYELLNEGWSALKLPNQRSVAEHLKKEAQLCRTALRARMEGIDSKISLALDAWHSQVGNMEFLGMYPSWIRYDRRRK